MIVADTDVLIDFLSGAGAAERVGAELCRGALVTTAITRFELLGGARTERQRRVVRELIEGLPTLPLDEQAADEAALIRRELESNGLGIGMADSLIAGIVRYRKGVLLTRNIKHFSRVEALKLAGEDEVG
jgi:predicted nucleic acid-binding protein